MQSASSRDDKVSSVPIAVLVNFTSYSRLIVLSASPYSERVSNNSGGLLSASSPSLGSQCAKPMNLQDPTGAVLSHPLSHKELRFGIGVPSSVVSI